MTIIRKGLLGLVTFGLGIALTTAANADISGTVFRDFNLNGTQQALEPSVSGITVTAYDDAGQVGASQTTDANGNYTLITPAGKYRVEVTGTPSYLNPGTAINGSTQPLVSVVDDATTHNVGLSNAGEYCQANPDIVVTRFVKGSHTSAPTNTRNALLQFNYENDNGTDPATDLAPPSSIGSVYGVAHFRKTNATYTSAYFKRHSDIGPAGIGAIYKIDHNSANAVSTFADLGSTDPRGSLAGYDWDHDTNGYADVAKIGIGDIEISDDETKLFAVNMEDRKLYVFDLDANGDRTATNSFDIPQNCAAQTVADDSRPMGLGFNDGTLYVGVTCTAESTVVLNDADDSYFGPRKGDLSKLSAHIFSFNPTTNTFSANPVVDIPLDYGRGCIYNGDISNAIPPAGCAQVNDMDGVPRPFVANWLPWQMDYDVVVNDKKPGNVGNQMGWNEYPQPLLSDIEFDNDGSMIIQIKDVNGDRTGYQNHSPNPADNTVQNGNAMGDIIRACGSHLTGWTLESNGSCGGVTTGGANNKEGLGGGEYYWYDNGPGGNGGSSGGISGHADTAMGGMLQLAGYPDFVTTAMDVHNFADNGLVWLRNDNGEISVDGSNVPKRLLVSEIDANLFFGKASGLGDIEALCDPAPIEIGNYVWEDSNNNGIQDPSETVLNDVTVELYEGATLVGTAVTDANGEYYFGGLGNTSMAGGLPLKLLTDYQIRIALNEPDLGGRVPTLKDVSTNSNDQADSDGDNGVLNAGYSTIAYTTGQVGETNHTLDFGFYIPVSLGSTVFYDIDNDGLQEAGEAGIENAVVKLFASDGTTEILVGPDGILGTADDAAGGVLTDADGDYYFSSLTEGDYIVKVTPPADAQVSSYLTGTTDNNVDGDDNGAQVSSGDEATSPIINLSVGNEPVNGTTANDEKNTGDNTTGDEQDDSQDSNGNMTVDFGFFDPAPSIDIEKATNTVDADTAILAVVIANVGDNVTWSFVVTNNGNETLNSISATDNVEGAITCPKTVLVPLESMTCTAITKPAVVGNYANTASVTGTGDASTTDVTDSDPSHYKVVPAPVIDIEKATNTVDADTAAAAVVIANVGDAVTWSYVITNNGNEDLNGISAADDKEGAITCPATTLAAGASMTCTAIIGTAVVGDYANTATVTGTGVVSGTSVNDSDPSHYKVVPTPVIDIEKATNTVDADTAAAAVVLNVGDTVTWSYVVTNNGNEDLNGISANDNLEGTITCPATTLAAGASMTCTAIIGTAVVGDYANTAAVTGTGVVSGTDVNDSDPSHYKVASVPSIDIEKFTNGDQAETSGAAVVLNAGDAVNWTYVVKNTGNVALTAVVVVDDQGEAVSCPATTLAVNAEMTCTASNIAVTGNYANIGSVEGTTPTGPKVTDTDPSHYTVTPKVSIGSIIWSDDNHNGVQDAGEVGISGVNVTLLDGSDNPVIGVAVQTTTSTGLYYFDGLPEGDYKIQVESPANFMPSTTQTVADNNDAENDSNIANSNGNIHTSGMFTLTIDGEPNGVDSNIINSDDADNIDDNNGNMTVDFGFVPTVKIGSLIWFEDDNDGIANGVITYPPADTIVTATATDGTIYTGTTDDFGNYEIEVSINDEYIVTISPPAGYQPTANSNDSQVPDDNSENNNSHNGAGTKVIVGLVDNMTLDFGFTPSAAPPPPGGSQPIPTLSEWALMLLMMMLGWIGYQQGLARKR